jgi:hypothetical protein
MLGGWSCVRFDPKKLLQRSPRAMTSRGFFLIQDVYDFLELNSGQWSFGVHDRPFCPRFACAISVAGVVEKDGVIGRRGNLLHGFERGIGIEFRGFNGPEIQPHPGGRTQSSRAFFSILDTSAPTELPMLWSAVSAMIRKCNVCALSELDAAARTNAIRMDLSFIIFPLHR